MFRSPRKRQPAQPNEQGDSGEGDGEAETSSSPAALERGEAGAGGPRGRLRNRDKPAVDADADADYPWTDERERQICAQDFLVRHVSRGAMPTAIINIGIVTPLGNLSPDLACVNTDDITQFFLHV